jgi:signal transduction histidine kinase
LNHLQTVDRKSVSPERDQTDEGLRTEREKTDQALAERHDAQAADAHVIVQRARKNADAVLTEARDNADAVLETARAKADERRGASTTTETAPRCTVQQDRLLEDRTIRDDRASADTELRDQRREEARALARLLPLERDKTDRYLLTERARSDDALANRDDFLGIVSHDLRDLLGGIVTSAELIAKSAGGTKESEITGVETKRIKRYAARMNRLVEDLLDVASIDAGKLAVKPVRGDVTTLIQEAAETFRAPALAKGIALAIELHEQPLFARLDHDRSLQVLGNLISNSIKFTPKGGRVAIGARRDGHQLRVSVSDTGSGIAAESLETIFDRFWQTGRNDRRGLGLGLYISRCIVEAQGGKIWAESRPGEGTQVFMTFPAGQ